MEIPDMDQVQESLATRAEALRQWMGRASRSEKELRLGPAAAEAVVAHVAHVDQSLERASAGEPGRCVVCHDHIESRRLQVDYTAQVCLEHLSREEAATLEREIELAQAVQAAMLPAEVPRVPGVEFAAFSRPAQFVGGDYFDFLSFASGRPAWAIGDVAGHGVAAGLQMAGVQALSRAIVPLAGSPAEALDRLHRLFVHNSRFTSFVSLFLAAYDPATRGLISANAGHNAPLVLLGGSSAGAVAWLVPTSPAVGLVEEAAFVEETFALDRGDLLILYTDGVVEAADEQGRQFGAERLVDAVGGQRGASAHEVVEAIRCELEAFVGRRELADDATIVVCRFD